MKALIKDLFFIESTFYPRAMYCDFGYGWPTLIVLALLVWWRL